LITDQSKKPSNVQYRPVKDFNIRESRPLKSNISQLLFFSFSPTPSFTEKYCFYVDFTPEADHLNANSAIKFRVSLLSFLLAWSVPPVSTPDSPVFKILQTPLETFVQRTPYFFPASARQRLRAILPISPVPNYPHLARNVNIPRTFPIPFCHFYDSKNTIFVA
jgi:hypothetical protein